MIYRTKILLVGLVALLVLSSCVASKAPSVASAVLIKSPTPGSTVTVGQTTNVETVGTCASGVSRIELWIDGSVSGKAEPPAGTPKEFPVTFRWTPSAPGTHTLEARARCKDGTEPTPFSLLINAVQKEAGATQAPVVVSTPTRPIPTRTETPEPTESVSPTQTSMPTSTRVVPYLVALTNLNVRTGPGIGYPAIGVLKRGHKAVVTGKNANSSWWQIEFPPGTEGRGWVSALYATAKNVGDVKVTQAPPMPTASPSPVPSSVPTSTPSPGGGQPTVEINFWADKTDINAGECTDIHWSVQGVREIYLDGAGVTGNGSKHVCPSADTTYTLHVVKLDGGAEDRQITIKVHGTVQLPQPTLPPVIILYPDLKVDAYSVSFPSGPHCGKPWNVHVSVTNTGSVAAGSFKVWWSVDSMVVREWTVNSLPVGGVWSQNFVHIHSCNQPSDLTTQVKVDPDNSVSESNENNNTSVLHVHITP